MTKKLSLALLAVFGAAQLAVGGPVIATGEQALAYYEALPGPASDPICTGACLPGHPCDPICTRTKYGNGYYCVQNRHTRTQLFEYICYQRD